VVDLVPFCGNYGARSPSGASGNLEACASESDTVRAMRIHIRRSVERLKKDAESEGVSDMRASKDEKK
jgi:hypothetical protein